MVVCYSTGGAELAVINELVVMCSHVVVFGRNSEKPVSLLRAVMYKERKL